MSTATLPARFKLLEIRKQNGTRAAIEWLVDRIGKRLIHIDVNEVVWLDVTRINPGLQADPDFEFRFLTAEEVAHWSQVGGYELDDTMAARVAAGRDLCFAALEGQRLAAFGWYALESLEPEHCVGVGTSHPAHVAHMYKGFTHPDFRGRRLHGQLMSLALQQLHEQRGITALASMVDWTNWASLKSCWRLGYESLGRIYVLGRGRLQLVISPWAARQRGVLFGRKANWSARGAS